MKIHSFSYGSSALEWYLEPVTFSDLTLLVGVSGVGKTQILRSLLNLKKIAEGRPQNGASWNISFSTADNSHYNWSGKYELNERYSDTDFEFIDDEESPSKDKPRITSERLERNKELIVTRNIEEMLLFGEKTPKLSPTESALKILNQEDAIAPASKAFQRIVHNDQSVRGYRFMEFPRFEKFAANFDTLDKVKESEFDPHVKLAIVYLRFPEIFMIIKERFIGIFPHVTDIKVEPMEETEDAPFFITQTPTIQIRERGVTKWINQFKISSGMLRTLFHISQLYLWPKGTVILIDEFENSLGVNCIDVVTEDLLEQDRDLQFIITSHHPYVINNVGVKYWKIVRRNGGKVYTQDASELGLCDSSHQAFIQLINHEEYREGISVR